MKIYRQDLDGHYAEEVIADYIALNCLTCEDNGDDKVKIMERLKNGESLYSYSHKYYIK